VSTSSYTSRALRLALWVASIAVPFALFAFAYSFVGFLHPQSIHLHDYSIPGAFVEVGGHILFGLLVAVPFLDLRLLLLSGSFAVLVDSDHILGALNLPVASRPDHSIVFILASSVFVYALSRRARLDRQTSAKVVTLAPAALLSHLSYDVLAAVGIFGGAGYAFPLLAPYSFAPITMPAYSWVVFELLGVSLTSATAYVLWMRRERGAAPLKAGARSSGNTGRRWGEKRPMPGGPE